MNILKTLLIILFAFQCQFAFSQKSNLQDQQELQKIEQDLQKAKQEFQKATQNLQKMYEKVFDAKLTVLEVKSDFGSMARVQKAEKDLEIVKQKEWQAILAFKEAEQNQERLQELLKMKQKFHKVRQDALKTRQGLEGIAKQLHEIKFQKNPSFLQKKPEI